MYIHTYIHLYIYIYIYILVQNLTQVCVYTVSFRPIQFLCILLLEERCVQAQALQHCREASQVPACLT